MDDSAGPPRIQAAEPADSDELLEILEPEVQAWFSSRFDDFTPPQRYAVKELHDRHNVLISSPTGTGKTLSAFLAALNELVGEAKDGELEDRVYVLYVSPLKALNNDIERNLEGPLEGICDELEAAGYDRPEIRVGVRTGDTSSYERQKMTKTPPHILITTPETLGIVLNAPTFSEHLTEVGWIIVDEVHSLAENKRGTHLMLSLERLEAKIRRRAREDEPPDGEPAEDESDERSDPDAGEAPPEPTRDESEPVPSERPSDHPGPVRSEVELASPERGRDAPGPVRIGLSATIHPLERIAGFLVGRDDGRRRPCRVVDVTYAKDVEVDVVAPVDEMVSTPRPEVTERLYEELDELIEDHETTLVFTNTRAGTERVVQQLTERFDETYVGVVGAHHGSMSKERRLDVEERLRDGELRVVVTSTSLELGIDIGSIDLVVLLSSPRGVSRALQRIGRSGHRLGATSEGALVALDRDDLIECTVIATEARQGQLDPLDVPTGGLDVLCQHLVGMALERIWDVDELFEVIRRAEPYHDLSREDFEACLHYLSSDDLNDHKIYPKIWWDREENKVGRRGKKTRPIYYTNIGTIPDSTQLTVKAGDDAVGTVDEEFVEQLSKGDVFTLGGSTWEYRGASPVKARVSPAASARPTVPRWVSETLPLSFEMAQRVAAFRADVGETIGERGVGAAVDRLVDEHQLDEGAAETIASYLAEQRAFAAIPGPQDALVEEHETDEGRARYVFHTPIGRRGCEALARAFSHRIEQNKDVDVSWMVNDYGFVLTLPPRRKLRTEEVRSLFLLDLSDELYEAIDDAELLRRRFRYVAARALMILRNYLGTDISVGRQNATARRLLRHLQREHPGSPVLKETYREILDDALDYGNASDYIFRFVSRQADVRFLRNLPGPSPLAFNLVAATSPSAVLSEERRELVDSFEQTVQEAIQARH